MKAWKPVQNLIFDLDDTLYQRRDPYLAAFHACFGQIQGLDEDALFRESRIIGDEEYTKRIRGEISMREMEVRRTTRTLQKFGIPVTNEEAIRFERAYQEALKTIRVNAGMQKVLDLAGKQGHFLGILTNGPRERQLGKFEALGLSRWIPLQAGPCDLPRHGGALLSGPGKHLYDRGLGGDGYPRRKAGRLAYHPVC